MSANGKIGVYGNVYTYVYDKKSCRPETGGCGKAKAAFSRRAKAAFLCGVRLGGYFTWHLEQVVGPFFIER